MYRYINDFLADWQHKKESTGRVFANITEDTKAIKINPNVRTLERLAWHLAQTITEMGTKAGLFDADPLEHLPVPATFAQIAELYEQYHDELGRAVSARYTDAALTDKVNMYGELWTKGTILHILIAHEAHHRSQMTVVMRMVGLLVPGIYGPAKEDWAAMGIPAME